MPPLPIVPDLGVFENHHLRLLPGFEVRIGEFALERRQDALGHRVVPIAPFAAHAAEHSIFVVNALSRIAGVLGGFNRSKQHWLFFAFR